MSKKRKVKPPPELPATEARAEPRPGLCAVVLGGLSLAIGATVALITPWDPGAPGAQHRTPPDEVAHVAYLQGLAGERRLPLLRSGSGNYEAHQPPLYYLAALPARQLGAWLDPPRDREGRGITWGVVLAERLWSVVILAGVVLSCYLLGRAVFPASPWLQLAAPAFALLLPGHTVNLAAVTNDGLAELFCSLALWQMVRLLRSPTDGPAPLVGLGALIGAALLTKTSCLFLLPVAVLAILVGGSSTSEGSSPWLRVATRAGIVVGTATVLWAGWIAHNLAHYPGDPLVTRTFVEIFGKDRATPETFFAAGLSFFGYLRLVCAWTWLSFWGVFGEAALFMGDWYYALGTLTALAAATGLAAEACRWSAASRESRAVWSVLIAAGVLVALQFLRFNMDFFQAQARYLFPAIGPIACAFVAGLDRAARLAAGAARSAAKTRGWLLGGAGVLMAVLTAAALIAVSGRGPVGRPPPWIGLP